MKYSKKNKWLIYYKYINQNVIDMALCIGMTKRNSVFNLLNRLRCTSDQIEIIAIEPYDK